MKIKKGDIYRYSRTTVYIDVVHKNNTFTVRNFYTNSFIGIFTENQINKDFDKYENL